MTALRTKIEPKTNLTVSHECNAHLNVSDNVAGRVKKETAQDTVQGSWLLVHLKKVASRHGKRSTWRQPKCIHVWHCDTE